MNTFAMMILTDQTSSMWSIRKAFERTIALRGTLIPALIPIIRVLSADYQLRGILLFKSDLMKIFILNCKTISHLQSNVTLQVCSSKALHYLFNLVN